MEDVIYDDICSLCKKRKKVLRFDKLKGDGTIGDMEGYFCLECLYEVGKLEE